MCLCRILMLQTLRTSKWVYPVTWTWWPFRSRVYQKWFNWSLEIPEMPNQTSHALLCTRFCPLLYSCRPWLCSFISLLGWVVLVPCCFRDWYGSTFIISKTVSKKYIILSIDSYYWLFFITMGFHQILS